MADDTEEELRDEASDAFSEVKKAIEEDRYSDAESLLEQFGERGAEWYYQRAMLCKKRNWYLESYRSMQEAVKLDPENEQYKQELEELEKQASPEEEEDTQSEKGKKGKKRKKQMGGMKTSCGDACADGGGECCAEVCCACICQGICEGIGNGC